MAGRLIAAGEGPVLNEDQPGQGGEGDDGAKNV
jgi:hypothetical protein